MKPLPSEIAHRWDEEVQRPTSNIQHRTSKLGWEEKFGTKFGVFDAAPDDAPDEAWESPEPLNLEPME